MTDKKKLGILGEELAAERQGILHNIAKLHMPLRGGGHRGLKRKYSSLCGSKDEDFGNLRQAGGGGGLQEAETNQKRRQIFFGVFQKTV